MPKHYFFIGIDTFLLPPSLNQVHQPTSDECLYRGAKKMAKERPSTMTDCHDGAPRADFKTATIPMPVVLMGALNCGDVMDQDARDK